MADEDNNFVGSLVSEFRKLYLPTFLRYKRETFIPGVLGFLKKTRSFPKISEEVWSLSKKSEVFRIPPKSSKDVWSLRTRINTSSLQVLFTSKIRDHEEGIVIYSFYTWLSFLTWVWATYVWKLCQPSRQQLIFLNQAWEIELQAWAGVRAKFSTCRHETHA